MKDVLLTVLAVVICLVLGGIMGGPIIYSAVEAERTYRNNVAAWREAKAHHAALVIKWSKQRHIFEAQHEQMEAVFLYDECLPEGWWFND